MDRTVKNESGFTLVELLVVVAIVGISGTITINRLSHMRTVNAINEDMHKASTFIHAQKMLAFTHKQPATLTVAGNLITSSAGQVLILKNTMRATGSPFSVTSRGNLSITSGDNISITGLNTGAEYSCVVFDTIRTRLGVWDGNLCNPI